MDFFDECYVEDNAVWVVNENGKTFVVDAEEIAFDCFGKSTGKSWKECSENGMSIMLNENGIWVI